MTNQPEDRLSHEEEYFMQEEQRLLAKMREQARLEKERQEMSGAAGISDEEILQGLQRLGFDAETVSLAHLVPLLQVAWAEGNVTKQERATILAEAVERGVKQDSIAYERLHQWLRYCPTDEFFSGTLGVLRSILATMPEEEGASLRQELVEKCLRVAASSGGFFGLGRKMSDVESEVVDHIREELSGGAGSGS